MPHAVFQCSRPFRLIAALFVCLAGSAMSISVHADTVCPLGVYPDGNMYDAESQYTVNTCSAEGMTCDEVYFYSQGGFAEARCASGEWRRVERVATPDADTAAQGCDYTNVPAGIDIVSTSAEVCANSNYTCDEGSSAFSNQCGCGCMVVPGQ